MINVLEQIKEFLVFDSEDDFYYLQILKRKKENPELGSNSYMVKSYTIDSIDYLELKMPEIIAICNFHNARACLNLNRRSYRKCTLMTLKKITDQLLNEDFSHTKKAYDSVCGVENNEKDKKWIVDVDVKDMDYINNMISFISSIEPNPGKSKIYTILETKNGFHLITSPFRVDIFKKEYSDTDIQKNNPINLYIP